MSLSFLEDEWLCDFFPLTEEGALTSWESDFVTDNKKRYESEGANLFLSRKQWEALFRIARKCGYALPDGRV